MCEFERWAKGTAVDSILYKVVNPLSAWQKESIMEQILEIRNILEIIRSELDLQVRTMRVDKIILSSCSSLWANLVELESKHLRRYGIPPPELADYMDAKVKGLNDHLQTIVKIVNSRNDSLAG